MKLFKVIFLLLVMIIFVGCNDAPVISEVDEYKVEFIVDGVVVDEQVVAENGSATLPDAPTKEGFTFIGWDQDVSKIVSNMEVNAIFEINKYTVKFLVDGNIVETQTVEYGKDAISLTPEKEGYDFIGWDQDVKNITSNLEVNAIFEVSEYKVTFLVDGNIIETQTIEHGKEATLPVEPTKEGYIFRGWDKEVGIVISDMEINAIFEKENEEIKNELNNISEELGKYFESLSMPLDSGNIQLLEKSGNASITWTSSDEKIIYLDGRVFTPYTSKKYETVTLTAEIQIEDYKLTRAFNVDVKRGYKDLSKGINAAYTYTTGFSEAALLTYDIVYYAFLYISNDTTGNLKNASSAASGINSFKNKVHEAGGRVLVSLAVQGGNDISNLAKICRDEATLATLVNNLLKFCKENDLDGIDIDWETPGNDGGDEYTSLMKKIYEVFKAENPNYLITSAIGAGGSQYNCYNLKDSAKYHDYINMMSYDLQASGLATFQNALYYKSSYCASQCSINDTLRLYLEAGVKSNQIIIGVPFYGRVISNTDGIGKSCGSNTAIKQSAISTYISGSYKEYYDTDCEVPYLYSETERKLVTYENSRSIAAKWKYISEKGLAGMMCWNYTQDSKDKLTIAMKSGKSMYMN